VMGIVLMSKV